MNILDLIAANLRSRPTTLRFPERPTPPGGFRGLVEMEPGRCLGCGICAYVCTSAAISVVEHDGGCHWSYDAGRCTFCGCCVDHCPGAALAMKPEAAPSYCRTGALREMHHVAFPKCPECGRPARPANDPLLSRAFAEVTAEVRNRSLLCGRCRQRRAQLAIKAGRGGRGNGDGE